MTTAKPDDRSTLVDPRVADAWHETSSEEPSTSVDAAILAAARREAGAKPELVDVREARAARRRWWPLAAAATVAAVAVGVLQVTPTDKLGAPATESAIVSDVPAPAAKPAPEVGTAAPTLKEEKSTSGDDARARNGASRKDSPRPPAPSYAQSATSSAPVPATPPAATPATPRGAQPTAPPIASVAPAEPRQQRSSAPAPAPDPFPAAPKAMADAAPAASGQLAASAPPPPAAHALGESDARAREGAAPAPPTGAATSRAERAASTSAPLAKMAPGRAGDSATDDRRANDRAPLPVADWIALIRRLRAEGKQAEAAKELAAFRAAHTDHEKLLPPDLRDWRPPEK